MIVTNKAGLPGAIVEAVKNDPYDPGDADISCTTLIDPPKIRTLSKVHSGEMVEDASDRIYALVGQAIHTILERAEPSAIVEKRLYMDMLGWKVSGQFDRMTLREATLQDYKMASVWEYMFGLKPEREAQLNVLAELCYQNGFKDIKNIEVVMIFRDWMKSKAKFDKDYPQCQVARIKVPLWERSARLVYIEQRVRLHQEAEKGRVEDCTAVERWAKPDQWAVMKKGRKSALRVLDSWEVAVYWICDNGYAENANDDGNEFTCNPVKGISIVKRPGENKRCDSYCGVSQWCDQAKKLRGEI